MSERYLGEQPADIGLIIQAADELALKSGPMSHIAGLVEGALDYLDDLRDQNARVIELLDQIRHGVCGTIRHNGEPVGGAGSSPPTDYGIKLRETAHGPHVVTSLTTAPNAPLGEPDEHL